MTLRVMVVDDEPGILNAVRRMLKSKASTALSRFSFEVETFDSPQRALLRAEEATFAVVLSDYRMPEMSGIDFLRRIKELQPSAARLILSGYADQSVLTRAINEAHVQRFLSKPWDDDELRSSIVEALEAHSRVDARWASAPRATSSVDDSGRAGEQRANGIGKVMVVDDDPSMRAALARVLVAAHIPVELFASGADLLAYGVLKPPAVLLLDVKMPQMSGIELQALLRERGITLPIVFLTGAADVPMAVTAMRNGAYDILEKPFDNIELVARIREALLHARESVPALPPRRGNADYIQRLATLTPRERQVHDLMVSGKSSKKIARDLGGSHRTIEIHRSRVMRKMGADTLADIVRLMFAAPTDA